MSNLLEKATKFLEEKGEINPGSSIIDRDFQDKIRSLLIVSAIVDCDLVTERLLYDHFGESFGKSVESVLLSLHLDNLRTCDIQFIVNNLIVERYIEEKDLSSTAKILKALPNLGTNNLHLIIERLLFNKRPTVQTMT